ncbi:RNA polymerase sigma factor region1.1 domain-containing protein [Methylobacterium organophilum]|nr:RNA polymerase sigma factor region1.1 domain-containing protein [Methylobacterium organophilum]
MTQVLDRGTLDRLVALGRDRGLLTADDLRAALPVERMDVDALVLVMLELEAAGVSVEPEAFAPPTDRPVPAAVTLPAPGSGRAPPGPGRNWSIGRSIRYQLSRPRGMAAARVRTATAQGEIPGIRATSRFCTGQA